LKPEGLAEEIAGAVAGARDLASNVLDLVGLETRRAGLSLMLMLACGIAGAILFVASWIALMGAVALWCVSAGIGWPVALAAAGLATAALTGALFGLSLRVSRDLAFPATRRQLRPKRLELV
jgi:hypothetical protein